MPPLLTCRPSVTALALCPLDTDEMKDEAGRALSDAAGDWQDSEP